MNMRSMGLAVLLFAAAALSLFLPAQTLFMGGGVFTWHMTQSSTYMMLAEIGVLFILFFSLCIFVQSIKIRLVGFAGIFLLFCWLHVIFLPMLVSGLYLVYIVLLGNFLRTRCFRADIAREYGVFTDFLLGCGGILTEFCLLSAFRAGGITVLRNVSILQAGLLFLWSLIKWNGGRKETGRIKHDTLTWFCGINRYEWLLLGFTAVMVLIQVGKMNITLDFDTLWYGVRSEYILDFGSGIYENPGLVGMAYVYSKGLETLLLPLSDLASHSYLLFFNIWLAVLGLMAVYRIARFYMAGCYALLSASLISVVPGVMNMSISAKSDIITWLLQLIMVAYFLHYVKNSHPEKRNRPKSTEDRNTPVYPVIYLILAAGAYALSLTMKPTSLVFSTAIFGMAGIYLIATKTLSLKAPLSHYLLLLPPAAALIGIWTRTMLITGMPVTSVFTSIFAKLGFHIKYPFATGALPQSWQEESNLHVLLRRLYQMLLSPEGKDMSHVVIAWGTSLLFFLLICILVYLVTRRSRSKRRTPVISFAHVLFWPFLAVNLISLVMLYQVDGNYFILLYTALILFSCGAISYLPRRHLKITALGLLVPVLSLSVLICAISNWAWALGFSDIKPVNSGRVSHRELERQTMIAGGNEEIWNILAQDPKTRVISFGEHPLSLSFPCIVQSYKDITAPWGNVELVNTPEAFEEYMEYSGADYVYVQAGYIGDESWSWSYGLLKDLIRRGSLTDLFFENGNVLLKVMEPDAKANNPEENFEMFMEFYRSAGGAAG